MTPEENIKQFLEREERFNIGGIAPFMIFENKSEILLTAVTEAIECFTHSIMKQTISNCSSQVSAIIEKEHAKMVNDSEYFQIIKEEVTCRASIDYEPIPFPTDLYKKSEPIRKETEEETRKRTDKKE